MNRVRRKHFSIFLMLMIVVPITVAVVVILGALHLYFGKRVEAEFHNRIRAQRGQVEILLEKRVSDISRKVKDLVSDNAIRVTLMLGNTKQLEDKMKEFYPTGDGVFFFLRKQGEKNIFPESYPGLTTDLIDFAFSRYPKGDVYQENGRLRTVWLLWDSIMHQNKWMGTAYALYDLVEDRVLIKAIQEAVNADIAILTANNLISLESGKVLPLEVARLKRGSIRSEFMFIDQQTSASEIKGFENIYFLSSLEKLNREKKRVTLIMWLFSTLVLAFSTILSVVLSRKMTRPLSEMTRKAIQISEGQKELQFENRLKDYWEFSELSQAFNYMLANLKDAEEQSRYKELFENVDDAVFILSPDGHILEANESAYRELGYSPEVFFNLKLDVIMPMQDARKILALLADASPPGDTDKIVLETFHLHSSGNLVPMEIHSRAIIFRGLRVVLNVARNISKRIEAEQALRESEERYRSVVENSSDGIMILDPKLRVLYANDVLSQILGYPRREITGADFRKYLVDGRAVVMVQRLLLENQPPISSPLEVEVVRKDGERRRVRIGANRFTDSAGKDKAVAQIMDITEQLRIEQEKRNLEAQLIQAQKMEAIGTLAGGIAHDFNNMLMAIQSRVSVMRLHTKPADWHHKHIEAIENTVMSAASLTEQLLGFARKGKYKERPTSLNDIVESSTQMFIRTRKEIKLHLNCQPDLWTVTVDRGQIEQVLVNLYVNAWQAMPEGGELFVQSQNVRLNPKFCKPYGITPGSFVKITVTDTGVGMDSATLERIFEPFFTTKDIGKGTGLGLASAYGIIKNHNGIIRAYSKKGRGATFSLYLPASVSHVAEERHAESDLIRGHGRILLVDDDPEALQAGELMLKELGYEVVRAGGGKEAIEIYRTQGEEIAMVTLDMVMPGMGGLETFTHLKDIDPDVKVLIISGYSLNKEVQELLRNGCCDFLQKPFNIRHFSQKLKEILAPGKPRADALRVAGE